MQIKMYVNLCDQTMQYSCYKWQPLLPLMSRLCVCVWQYRFGDMGPNRQQQTWNIIAMSQPCSLPSSAIMSIYHCKCNLLKLPHYPKLQSFFKVRTPRVNIARSRAIFPFLCFYEIPSQRYEECCLMQRVLESIAWWRTVALQHNITISQGSILG